MAAAMTVDTSALKDLSKKLKDPKVRRRIENLGKEKGAAAIISQAIADNFASGGPGWKPLKIRDGQPLQKTGLLKKAATTVGHKNNIYRAEKNTITWGTNLVYAGIHQHGGRVVAKNAKALFIPLTKKAEKVGPIKDPSLRTGKNALKVGKDVIFAKAVNIPARPFLVIRPVWMKRLEAWMKEKILQYIKEAGL